MLERHQHGKDEQAVSEPDHTRRSRRICASRTTATAKMRAAVSAAAGNSLCSGWKGPVLKWRLCCAYIS